MDIKRLETAKNVDAYSDRIRRALDPEIERRREEYLDVQVTHQQQQDQAMASNVFFYFGSGPPLCLYHTIPYSVHNGVVLVAGVL